MSVEDKVYGFVGLATKARKSSSGEEICEKLIKKNRAYLVLIAKDTSVQTKSKFERMCSSRDIPIRFIGDKQRLGKAIGKIQRAIVVIQDENFSIKIQALIDSIKE